MRTIFLAIACFVVAIAAHAADAEVPGRSAPLFAVPGYICTKNLYVAATGSDSTGNGSIGKPWATLQKANASAPSAGTCVNVEPGVYAITSGIALSHGGNANTPIGYVVYRSTTLGGAILRSMSSTYNIVVLGASYLWLDGFNLDGNRYGCAGKPCNTDYNVKFLSGTTTHHQRLTNNYSHDSGGGGFGAGAGGDCAWVIHNIAAGNASTSGYAESGISIWEPNAVSGVSTCDGSSYHFQIMWNISKGNLEGSSIPSGAHTDGDGIILDTFSATSYPYASLVAFNLAMHNGGFCVGQDGSNNITFANNSCYSNFTDPLNTGTWRGELFSNGGNNNTYINNVVQAVTGAGVLSYNITGVSFNTTTGTTWSNNVLYGAKPQDYTPNHTDPISCTTNKCNTNPLYVAPTDGNFALQATSPAIGYGLLKTFLPITSIDAGVCSSKYLQHCP